MELVELVRVIGKLANKNPDYIQFGNYVINFLKKDPEVLQRYLWDRFEELQEILRVGHEQYVIDEVFDYFNTVDGVLADSMPVEQVRELTDMVRMAMDRLFENQEELSCQIAKKAIRDSLMDYENLIVR